MDEKPNNHIPQPEFTGQIIQPQPVNTNYNIVEVGHPIIYNNQYRQQHQYSMPGPIGVISNGNQRSIPENMSELERQYQIMSRHFKIVAMLLGVINAIGFILCIWSLVVLSTSDTPDDIDSDIKSTMIAIFAVLSGVTFIEFWSMFFGYKAVIKRNLLHLKIFMITNTIWILFDLALVILARGGGFLLLVLPFVLSLFLTIRGRKIMSLLTQINLNAQSGNQNPRRYQHHLGSAQI